MQLLSLPSKGDPAWTPTDWNAQRKVSWNGPNDGGAGPAAAPWPKMRDVDDQTDQGSATPGTSFGNDVTSPTSSFKRRAGSRGNSFVRFKPITQDGDATGRSGGGGDASALDGPGGGGSFNKLTAALAAGRGGGNNSFSRGAAFVGAGLRSAAPTPPPLRANEGRQQRSSSSSDESDGEGGGAARSPWSSSPSTSKRSEPRTADGTPL